jgi:hypothetical protein
MAKMAHMGTQLANAAAAASIPDVSKQNVKNAKTKKDIVDAGRFNYNIRCFKVKTYVLISAHRC